LGLTQNTIIVLWGDHGWHLGDHDLWCKHTNFEQATHAPLMISMPGIAPNRVTSMTEFVDIFPTLCDLAEISKPTNLDGKSLVPLMESAKATIKDYSVSQYPHQGKMGYTIRTKRYRLTYWMKEGYRSNMPYNSNLVVEKELYDYQKDPLETVSFIGNTNYTAVQKDLENKMIAFFKSQRTN
jgi:iduronate 2-sulfatase